MIGSSSMSNRLFMRFPVGHPEHKASALPVSAVDVEAATVLRCDLTAHPQAEAAGVITALRSDDRFQGVLRQRPTGMRHAEHEPVGVGAQLRVHGAWLACG